MSNAAEHYRQIAEKCHRLADQLSDEKAIKSLRELALEYERKAQETESD